MSSDFEYLREAGVYYSHRKPPTEEEKHCIVLTYWWKYVETEQSGQRTIWILAMSGQNVMARAMSDLDKLIAFWTLPDKWLYSRTEVK